MASICALACSAFVLMSKDEKLLIETITILKSCVIRSEQLVNVIARLSNKSFAKLNDQLKTIALAR